MLDLFDTVDTTLKYWFLYQQEGTLEKHMGMLLTIPIQAFHTLKNPNL